MLILLRKFRALAVIPLFFPLVSPQSLQATTISPSPTNTIQSFLVVQKQSFPDMRDNYQKTVVEPLQAALKAEQDKQAAVTTAQATVAVTYVFQASYSELTGSYGYAIPGNCVNEIPYNLRAPGNPISWPATSGPYIGGAALWAGVNHVARITGFWSNGDIEVAQQGWSGAPVTRFPRSTFRGYR